MDLMALSIFLLAFVVCSILVFFISVYGTKEVSFEENLKASQQSGASGNKKKVQDSKKKTKKVAKTEAESKSDLEEKPVTPNPTPEPEDTPEIETILDEQASKVSETFLQPPVEDLKNSANSSAEPTPKKSRNKKNKIKIEEVEADEPSEVDVVQTFVTNDVDNEIRTSSSGSGNGHVVEEKKNAKSKKKKAKDDISEKHGDSTTDLIPLIMKTPMDDMEIQNVIDLLLTKQIGTSAPVNHDWVEASEKNETKQLQRQLAEKETLLADEVAKSKSLTDRMNVLRQELNNLKTAHVQTQRYVSDQESQRKHLEARLHAEMETHSRYVQTLQGQIQYHSSRAQSLQHSLDSLSAQQVNQQIDPAIYNELETLRSIKMSLEAEKHNIEINMSSLHGQLNQQQEEFQQMQQKLSKKSNDLEDTKNSLKNALDRNEQLTERLSGMEKKNHLDSEFEEIKRVNQDLEIQVQELSSKCLKQKNELSRLTEENERFSDQLATYVERPKTEGREANGSSTPEPNGNGTSHDEDNEWHKKYLAKCQEHEQIIKEKDVILQKLQTTESQFKSQVSKLESDLKVQKSKNNDKNQTEIQSVKKESEQSQKQFLQRLFPEVKAPKVSKSHSDWLEDFACQVNKYKDVNKQLKEASPVKAEVDQEQINKLEGQVQHYQSVLNATENLLRNLQATVESEESQWKSKANCLESELEDLQRKLEATESKNAALEASMNSLSSAEEVN